MKGTTIIALYRYRMGWRKNNQQTRALILIFIYNLHGLFMVMVDEVNFETYAFCSISSIANLTLSGLSGLAIFSDNATRVRLTQCFKHEVVGKKKSIFTGCDSFFPLCRISFSLCVPQTSIDHCTAVLVNYTQSKLQPTLRYFSDWCFKISLV